MARRRLAALLLSIGIAIVLPVMALAATNPTGDQQVYGTGLVPCGVSSDSHTATECEACNVVQLLQNLINFMIGLAIPIAVVLIAYAGFLYFTSATGGHENISKAKKIFSSSLIGFVLALCAWLIVNTILNTVVNHDLYPNSSWFRIDCSTTGRITNGNISDVIAGHLGVVPTVPEVTTTYSCGAGEQVVTLAGGERVCENTTTHAVSSTQPKVSNSFVGKSTVLCPQGNSACSPEVIMSQTGVSQARANAMSCIAMTESSGNPQARSDSSTACGTFQLLRSNWNNSALHSGNCSTATACTNYECNLQAAIALGNATYQRTGSYYGDWTCPGCNYKAAACVQTYDPGH